MTVALGALDILQTRNHPFFVLGLQELGLLELRAAAIELESRDSRMAHGLRQP